MYTMTYSKMDFKFYFASLRFALLIFLCAFLLVDLEAQDNMNIRLSGAVAIGYAPSITFGDREDSGVVFGFYGELEYGKMLGRLQYTKPLSGTLNDGKAFHGGLGYRFDVADQLSVGLMLSGGATLVHYNNGINGSQGDTFTNVSPQVGVNLAPNYQITDAISIQAGLRYYKGFKAGDRGKVSDLIDFSVGLRYSILK